MLRKYFWQNSLFHSAKEVFLQTFRQFLENWIFDGKSTAGDLTKMVKICTISKCAKKIFFGKILCSTHQKKCFSKLLGSFWKIEFLMENRQPRTLQKWWKFCTISKCAKKTFFGKILYSTHQKKCFYKLLGSFWKIDFLTENRQPRPLQKWWKFCTISKCAKNFFSGKNSLFHSAKEVFLQTFRQFLQNWIFDGKSTAADLTKLVKILYYLKCAKKIFFGQNCLFHSSKEVFLQTFRQFLENWIFDGKSTAADLTKMVKILYYLKMS